MAGRSSIEWTDETWNPIVGCTIVSPGCTNCYAMKMAGRLEAMSIAHEARHGGDPGPLSHYRDTTKETRAGSVWTGKIGHAGERTLTAPLRWKKPRMVFVNSMGDLFHEDIPDEWIDQVFAVMALAPQHTFQVLTKRSKRMREYVSDWELPEHLRITLVKTGKSRSDLVWPLPNVWLGVSAENQATADERIPDLLATPAAIRFVSAEPLLGPLDFNDIPWPADRPRFPETDDLSDGRSALFTVEGTKLDWIIVGGESGDGARPMHPDWPRAIRDQCKSADAAFFFKQWGSHAIVYDRDVEDPDWRRCNAIQRAHPNGRWLNLAGGQGFHGERVVYAVPARKSDAGRQLDGVEHNGMPAPKEVPAL